MGSFLFIVLSGVLRTEGDIHALAKAFLHSWVLRDIECV